MNEYLNFDIFCYYLVVDPPNDGDQLIMNKLKSPRYIPSDPIQKCLLIRIIIAHHIMLIIIVITLKSVMTATKMIGRILYLKLYPDTNYTTMSHPRISHLNKA